MTAGITAPVIAMGTAMFKTFADFDLTMTEIGARTQATAEELKKMSDFAIQMGADTMFSAQQAAEALLELTSSGSSAAEAMEQLPAVLDLAATGALDLGEAADGVTDILSQFQQEAYQSASVADTLAKAAGASSATVSDLIQAFGNVGPVAHQFGLGVNETAAALAVLAENGIKGAESGTALKSMLSNMARDTDTVQAAWKKLGTSMFDAAGNMRPIDDVLKDIAAAMENMTMEEQVRLADDLAGAYGKTALNALLAENGISGMQSAMEGAAGASEVAGAMMNTLAGRWQQFVGSLETLGIVLGGLGEGPLTSFLAMLTNIINAFTKFAQEHPRITQAIMLIVAAFAAIGPVLIIVGQLMSMWATLSTLFAGLPALIAGIGPAIAGIAASFGGMLAAIVPLLPMIAALGIALGALWAVMQDQRVKDIPKVWGENFRMLGEIMGLLAEKAKVAGSNFIAGFINGMKDMIGKAIKMVVDFSLKIGNTVKSILKIQSPSKVMEGLGKMTVAGFNEGIASMGGIGVQVPALAGAGASVRSTPASGGSMGMSGGNVYIQTINVPPGTSKEQIDFIMQEIGRQAKRRGVIG